MTQQNNKFLKMSDVFSDGAPGFPAYWSDEKVKYAAHAINSHDELVREVGCLQEIRENQEAEIAKMVYRAANAENQLADALNQRDLLFKALKFSREVFHNMSEQARTRGDQQYFTDLLTEGNIIDRAIASFTAAYCALNETDDHR